MRKTAIILGLMLVAATSYAQQAWYWQNPLPQGNHLESVYFTDANNGWAVGGYGTILSVEMGKPGERFIQESYKR